MDRAEAFLNRATLRALRRRLGEREAVRRFVQGERAHRRGDLVATDSWLVWARRGRLWGVHLECRPIAQLVSWEARGQGRAGFLRLEWPDGAWAVDRALARSALAFCAHLDERRTGARAFEPEEKDPHDEAERLGRVARLEQKGLLGKDEARWFRRRR